jgi:hypothetical protein
MDNMINAPLWQKIVAACVAVLVVLWGFYTYLAAPKLREIRSLKDTLKSVEMEIELIAPKETIVKEGLDVKELIRKEIDELMKKIPTESEDLT